MTQGTKRTKVICLYGGPGTGKSTTGAFPYICDDIVAKFEKEANARGVEFIHIFLNRVKPYQAEGRHQDEAGAREIDAELKEYLTRARIPIIEVDADDGAAERIISLLRI